MRAWVVIDLGFGDAGKGLVTDALVRRTGARLVVRYNGGAQAGHNVVTPDGRHHTFAQVGAGAFVDGVDTILGPRVVVHPTALLGELAVLTGKGVSAADHVTIAAPARVITPYHQALNRLRELARAEARHGSCGVGVGETVAYALAWPDEGVVAGDLARPERVLEKLAGIRAWLGREADVLASMARAAGHAAAREHSVFMREDLAARWVEAAAPVARWVRPLDAIAARVATEDEVVFEGAQGVLLDEDHGFHPHTTWSRCTDVYARELVDQAGVHGAEVVRVGVTRAFAVRHGAGPLPTEDAALAGVMHDHNAANPWQGPVRAGHFDAVLLRYALGVLGGVDRLVVTHMDAAAGAPWRAADRYVIDGEEVVTLPVSHAPTLEAQAALGARLARANAVLGAPQHGEQAVRAHIATLLGRPVDAVSRGPCATDLEEWG